MSVTSGFFNSLSGDRKYDAIQISSMFDGLITDGIYNGFLESFMVTASDPASMVVTVGEGRCWFNHIWTLNDAPLPLTLDVGDVVLNRIDTVVIDVDSTDTVRACTIKVVKGTPSSQAVAPTLENTETHHQYPLCDISVVAGATTVTQSNITNRRGTSDCPFVATLMTTVTVDELLVQWESQWNDWMTDRTNSMDSWTAEQQEAFTTWFQTVQDILDENTAGNLLNRINHRTGINATATYSEGVVAITAPDDAGEILTFVAPSDFLSSDTYTLNGEALTITDLNGEALDDSWKKNSPVTITVSGGKAFFKAGGSGKNDTLPPLLGNMTVEVVEGDGTDTYTIKMDKLILDKTTEMVGGAQLEWGEEMPAKPGKGTGGIKTWTREEVITTGKPYDGLYLGDVTPSDAVIPLRQVPTSTSSAKVIIKVPENGTETNFIALRLGYGGVPNAYAMIREDTVNTSIVSQNFYENSNLDKYFTDMYKTFFNETITSYLVEVPVDVANIQITRSIFAVSAYEVGSTLQNRPVEGSPFSYFETVANRGSDKRYQTRSLVLGMARHVIYIEPNGSGYSEEQGGSSAPRPIICLDADGLVKANGDGTYTFVGDEPASSDFVSHTVEVPHGQKVVFRQFTQNQKKQFQTMLVGGVYPPLGDVEPPFALPEFTGNCAIFGDETAGRIELYEAGELTLSPGTYDIFMVGGGASGAGHRDSDSAFGTAGGGSGYTKTIMQKVVDRELILGVIIGAGGGEQSGEGCLAGSETSIDFGDSIESVSGGTNTSSRATTAAYANGTDGGSGGGSNSANAGLNGLSDGKTGGIYQSPYGSKPITATGKGQETTTRAFGEPEGTLYAGGGGGSDNDTIGSGGLGGGGNAGQKIGNAGTPNTGSGGGGAIYDSWSDHSTGGAGGSGIIIIRWNNAAS